MASACSSVRTWALHMVCDVGEGMSECNPKRQRVCYPDLTHWGWYKWPLFTRRHFEMHFLNENVCIISIEISLKFVSKAPISNVSSLFKIMAWCRLGDKPLSKPMMASLLTHICVTRPQWVELISADKMDGGISSMTILWPWDTAINQSYIDDAAIRFHFM